MKGEHEDLEAERSAAQSLSQFEKRLSCAREFSGKAQSIEPGEQKLDAVLSSGDRSAGHEQLVKEATTRSEELEAARQHQISIADLSQGARTELQRDLQAIDAKYANNPDSTKAKGDRGEAIARVAIEERGLPTETGWRDVDAVVAGQYDGVHGIDLVAVQDGKPVVIEVKYHHRPILAEHEEKELGLEGKLATNLEMGDGWTRRRWQALLRDDEKRLELALAGVDSSYLTEANFATADSTAWKAILSNKRVVVISDPGSEGVNGTLMRQAHERNIAPHHILTVEM